MQPLVELHQVGFQYNTAPVLEDINLHIHPGQFAALVGPSGAGKTTLLKLILGMTTPTTGSVSMHAKDSQSKRKPIVGYVPQLETVDWNFPVTVEQVVLMGAIGRSHIWPWPKADERKRVQRLLEQLDIGGYAHQHILNLSGGQQQRVFLARALIAEPDFLVLDEPTTGVDMRTAEQMLHLLADLNHGGMTILMTTHDLNAAAAHVPWMICLNRQVIAQGSPECVLTPEILEATYHSDMIVFRQNGMLFVQPRPHGHTYHDILPNVVPGEVPMSTGELHNEPDTSTVPV